MVRHCHRIWAAARQVLIRQGDRVKKAADRKRRPAPHYQPGQRVWLSAKDLHIKVSSKKLALHIVGPFPVSRLVGPAAVRLRLSQSLRVHPTFHVSQVKPAKESPMVPVATPPPPLEVVDGGPVYKVKQLLAVRSRGRGRQFLVDWEGYGPEERQWVPSRHIVDHTLIDDFYRDHPEQANFESKLVAELLVLSGVGKSRMSPYHPMGNGTTERFNRTLGNMLRSLPPGAKHKWPQMIQSMTFVYNCTAHETTGFAPFYLMFGQVPRLPVDLMFRNVLHEDTVCNYNAYVKTLVDDLRTAMLLAQENSAVEQKHQTD